MVRRLTEIHSTGLGPRGQERPNSPLAPRVGGRGLRAAAPSPPQGRRLEQPQVRFLAPEQAREGRAARVSSGRRRRLTATALAELRCARVHRQFRPNLEPEKRHSCGHVGHGRLGQHGVDQETQQLSSSNELMSDGNGVLDSSILEFGVSAVDGCLTAAIIEKCQGPGPRSGDLSGEEHRAARLGAAWCSDWRAASRCLPCANGEGSERVVEVSDRERERLFSGLNVNPTLASIHQYPSIGRSTDSNRIRIAGESSERRYHTARHSLRTLRLEESPKSARRRGR